MCNFFSIRIETLGCRLNQVESEALAVQFQNLGFPLFFKVKKNNQHLDYSSLLATVGLCVVNTCTVTGKAEQKARRLIRLLLKENTNAIVIVTGCYAELESKSIETIDERVIAFSGKLKDELIDFPNFLKSKIKSSDSQNLFKNIKSIVLEFRKNIYLNSLSKIDTKKMFKLSSPVFVFHSRASLKVQDGCNNACAFCRIRLARGKAVSLPAEEAVSRLKKIEQNGANEVVLTGVNLAQYRDLQYGKFPNLLQMLLENTSNIRIRISSLYPESVTDELLPILRHNRICPHFHLSIQSGSDKILQLMKRQYRREDIIKAICLLRTAKNNPFIGCDIITGFPSETTADFEQTYSLCKDLKIPGIHVFPFSARPGTLAFSMKNKIPQRDSGERASQLSNLSNFNYSEYSKLCIGKVFFAIVEQPIPNKSVQVITENYLSRVLKPFDEQEKKLINSFKGGEAVSVTVIDDEFCRL